MRLDVPPSADIIVRSVRSNGARERWKLSARCSRSLCQGSALRCNGYQWAPQGGAAVFLLTVNADNDAGFSATRGR